jgi:NAD(P)-dependent dehydrogenase (short-subunit alcohol dehydrogenase family)
LAGRWRLARRGYKVAATARRGAELEALAAESQNIFSFPGDVTDRAGMAGLAGEIEASHGQIALAFINAGVYFVAEQEKFSADVVWCTFEINFGGTVNCLDPVLAAMQRRGRGQVALNASLAGHGGIEGSLAYGSTKAALIYMAEALKLTYERTGLAHCGPLEHPALLTYISPAIKINRCALARSIGRLR